MTENLNTTDSAVFDDFDNATPEVEAPVEKPATTAGVRDKTAFEAGSWQAKIVESTILTERSAKATKRAGILLWGGATTAITEWEVNSDVDVHAEVLAANLLDIMGTSRKGDVSKIKTVALAVKNAGLALAKFESLSKAYAEATRLTKTVVREKADDVAGDAAIEALSENVPTTASTGEQAAQFILAQGMDEAARLLLDALNGPSGENNTAAHRSLLKAIASEIGGRNVKPEVEKVAASAKPKPATAKAKPAAAAKAKPAAAKAKPVSVSQGETAPVKAKPAPVKAKPAPVKR